MKSRVILVCTLLVLAAVPSFALPQCKECNASNFCSVVPGALEVCQGNGVTCDTFPNPCSRPFQGTVATEWTVTSIEISRPSRDSITVTAPAPAAEVRDAEPAAQK